MRDGPKHDRTVRLLTAQLEAIAVVGERRPVQPSDLDPYVQRTAAATRNAVRLSIITSEEAEAIWTAVAQRHPATPWARLGPLLAA
jgi:hypothetical protein